MKPEKDETIRYSIICCAFNAVGRIENTMEYLARLSYPKDKVELVLVDNNSRDKTVEICVQKWKELGAPFELVVRTEKRQGLANARWSGVSVARGSVCVFCDDDNWLSADYLTIADECFSELGQNVVLGGASTPVFDFNSESVPAHFYSHCMSLAIGAQSLEREDVTIARAWLMGAGLVIPKYHLDDLASVGFSHGLNGRSGAELTSGEDVELCYALVLRGRRLWSVPDLQFKHYIPENRLSVDYIKKIKEGNNQAKTHLLPYRALISLRHRKVKRFRSALSQVIRFVRAPDQLTFELMIFTIFGSLALRNSFALPLYLLRTSPESAK